MAASKHRLRSRRGYPRGWSVVAMAPGSAVFVGDTPSMETSAFTWHDQPLPFVPVPWSAVPDLLRHRLRPAFEKMLADTAAVEAAAIPVERIHGPVYLMSGTRDELWPSTGMSEAMMQRLDAHHFAYPHRHDAFNGNHTAPLKRMDLAKAFLATNFLAASGQGCPRSTCLQEPARGGSC